MAWNYLYNMLIILYFADTTNALVDMDFLFGRYGLSVWPIWTFCLADMDFLFGQKRLFLAEMAWANIVFGRIGIDWNKTNKNMA